MSDIKHFIQISKISPSDRTILFLTFFLTVLVDLTVAIGVGVTFASLLFMRHMSKSLEIRAHTKLTEYDVSDNGVFEDYEVPEGLCVLQINGPLFFGASSTLIEKLENMQEMPKVLILRMRFMPYLDASGEASFEDIFKICKKHHTYIIFSAIRQQPRSILTKAGIFRREDAAFVADFPHALELAKQILDTKSENKE